MTGRQRVTLFAAALVVAAMLLFPPFRYSFGVRDGRETNIGYAFILTPPVLEMPARQYPVVANVHWPLLLTQWAGVVLVAGMLVLAFRRGEPR